MINKRNYLNYVTMIDSECDNQRNSPMISTNSNFYRSPLRDRENRMNISNVSNTPLRSGKASLSPLRLRKGETNNASNISTMSIRSTQSKRKQVQQQPVMQQGCFNHPQKVSKFYIIANEQNMYCCQKCAILLASQGFTVCKMESNVQQSSRKQSHPRKIEIEMFMSRLQNLTKNLKLNDQSIQQKFNHGQSELQQQISKIQDYYEQFYQILNQHKKRVLSQVRQQYQKNNTQLMMTRKSTKEAIDQAQSMKKDILDSWDDIIFVAQEDQYRPVITAYNEKLQSFQKLTKNGQATSQIIIKKIAFKNTDSACEALQKGLQVQWEDQQKQEQQDAPQEAEPQLQHRQQSEMAKYSTTSDLPQNPVQCIQKDEQKFIKSSLKDLVGLFSSFEE